MTKSKDFIPLPLAAKATGERPDSIRLACRRGTVPGAFQPFGAKSWLIPAELVRSGKILQSVGKKARKDSVK